ncbi:hypothetical protein [Streptomyces montanisoli]|uniref:Uncharacterized protein n=1 Tax=Streptomyces montanisoli TaxID=2798581 RepID=A0A940MFC3_9ACTN|nr:hypothetical protein [Streptomyces montanisoli]MBP0458975.1 hypothetical protein [Streptomyces montanisoli]
MQGLLEELEKRMQQLLRAMTQARLQGDDTQVAALSEDLKRTQAYWASLALPDTEATQTQPTAAPAAASRPAAAARPARSALPLREQVCQALTLLTVPTAPKVLSQVHEAFFAQPLNTARLTSLRRDEERSYRASSTNRTYYICPALTCDLLAPARALLALSNWPLEQRLVGPITHRVHFLTAALRIADAAEQRTDDDMASGPLRRLLEHYSGNIPGYPVTPGHVNLEALRAAAKDELAVHVQDDANTRAEAAERARTKLDDADQIFGHTLHDANRARRTA